MDELRTALQKIEEKLLSARNIRGFWTGRLSSSALSTATAVSALSLGKASDPRLIENGLRWLAACQNDDGGWGDTDKSPSNLPTTLLAGSAFTLSGRESAFPETIRKSEDYISEHAGRTNGGIIASLRKIYGEDRTFIVPILMNLALAGKIEWGKVPSLPFEIAALPFAFYRIIKLPVVSYALPALIAIGHAAHFKKGGTNILKSLTRNATLAKLRKIQPESGGYLEAVPLTAFVSMGIISVYGAQNPVAANGLRFLRESVRPDGSWPIDSDISVWLTTQAVQALPDDAGAKEWLLGIQNKSRHKYTDSPPGGWGWSNLSGSVPDADDTSGALIALHGFGAGENASAAKKGARWLLDLQNSDGGFPTFCRGWMKLPFDKSSADITAHALRALSLWKHHFYHDEINRATRRALEFLELNQNKDGSWSPLWFGSHYAPDISNRTYGTARALVMYRELGLAGTVEAMLGTEYLIKTQNTDGSWGGVAGAPGTIEETSLAVLALFGCAGEAYAAWSRGVEYLKKRVIKNELEPAPIGLYFQSLWYYEELYPLIWGAAALKTAAEDATHRREI